VWLDSLRAALDEASGPVDFFLRDDDAGWDDERLFAMLEVVERHALPIDLAVIPQALSPSLADSLIAQQARSDAQLGLHQHGLAHRNHESDGRKCEFGPSPSATAG
jgi:hypothetical protein